MVQTTSQLILCITVVFLACNLPQLEDTESNRDNRIVCVILFDGTGSFQYVEKTKHTASSLIRELPGGSRVYLRWILAESVSDRATILSSVIPEEPTRPANPFATAAQNEYMRELQRSNAVREQIISGIRELDPPNAKRTDILGAIFSASQRFKNNTQQKPLLVILSDMVENVWGNYPATDLTGVHVRILDYQVEPGEDGGREQWWTERFSEHNAESVEFYYLDDLINFNLFLGGLQ